MRALCVIPARGGSRRFPKKNLALFRGVPLVGCAIDVAKASGVFQSVAVSSDDEDVLEVARRHGADVVHRRSSELARYDRQVKDVCRSVIDELAIQGQQFDVFGVLLPTSPLRTSDAVRDTCRALLESGAECAMSLVACGHPPQRALAVSDGRVRPFFGAHYLRPAEHLEPLFRHDGTALFAQTAAFLAKGGFYELSIAPHVVDARQSVDIDAPIDLEWAEFLASR